MCSDTEVSICDDQSCPQVSRGVWTQKYPVEMFRAVHRCQEVMRYKRYTAKMSRDVCRCQEVF